MELPKNITQIGEVGRDCKVYAEDYVISYLKQLNRTAQNKEVSAALYGKRTEEDGIVYLFLYGACRLTLLQREVRHLSQAQYQEIERLRRKYFPDYVFLGYRLLDGEMIEGFHICEQEICRYIAGYAQFYEKNDQMLSYMLENRKDAEPEQIDQEKYEEVKKRQEERRAVAEGQTRGHRRRAGAAKENAPGVRRLPASENLQKMRITAASVFVLLCLLGFVTLKKNSDGNTEELQAAAKQWVDSVLQQQIPDAGEAVATSGSVAQKDVLVMEDKLEQALLEENKALEETDATPTEEVPDGTAPETEPVEDADPAEDTGEAEPAENDAVLTSGTVTDPQPETVAYVIKTGDTLIGISRRQYGSDVRVADICSVNKIADPDDIKEGQVILLPR